MPGQAPGQHLADAIADERRLMNVAQPDTVQLAPGLGPQAIVGRPADREVTLLEGIGKDEQLPQRCVRRVGHQSATSLEFKITFSPVNCDQSPNASIFREGAPGCMLRAHGDKTAPYETQTAPEGHMQRVGVLCVLVAILSVSLAAQVPTGTIAGTVTDQVGAVLPGAAVTVTSKATGAARDVVTGPDGTF